MYNDAYLQCPTTRVTNKAYPSFWQSQQGGGVALLLVLCYGQTCGAVCQGSGSRAATEGVAVDRERHRRIPEASPWGPSKRVSTERYCAAWTLARRCWGRQSVGWRSVKETGANAQSAHSRPGSLRRQCPGHVTSGSLLPAFAVSSYHSCLVLFFASCSTLCPRLSPSSSSPRTTACPSPIRYNFHILFFSFAGSRCHSS